MLTSAVVPLTDGLSSAEAAERLVAVGPNRLADPEPRPRWRKLADQFRSPLILVLLGAVVLALVVGDLKDAVVIAAIVTINAVLGYVQEQRAERSLDALRTMLVARARVRRDGVLALVDAVDIVPGDVVCVEAGDRIPADGTWVAAHDLAVDESTLTGESVPVEKTVDGDTATGRGDGAMNTVVTRGRGELVVTATGMATRMGAVARLLNETDPPVTPLQRQLDRLAHRLIVVVAVAVTVVFTLGLVRGGSLSDELLGAVALATAAIPEGLPAVVTVTLALGTRHLARRGAIVKRLASVETLGATTVIASDKTGTLTVNQMTARRIVLPDGGEATVTGEGYAAEGEILSQTKDRAAVDALARAMATANDARLADDEVIGDPMEGALLVLAAKARTTADPRPRIAEVPFDSAHKLMATFHRADDGGIVVYVKGAPDVLLPLSGADPVPVTAQLEGLATDGLRVLAAATRRFAPGELDVDRQIDPGYALRGLRFLGLVGIVDPPRAEAAEAIAMARRAGISVKMITGDHATTAAAIASQVGIDGEVVTGTDLDRMDDAELVARVSSIGVFARVKPEHKLRLVEALRSRGEVVAMTGDGVNDAPALKGADIGVAMGITGTEVSKEAATMVLTDDNVATIVAAVHRGRAIYDNIVTFVRFQLTTNVGAILTLVTAASFGLARPFTAVQVLWVNLICDGPPALALGTDEPGPDAMSRSPRRSGDGILTARRFGVITLHGVLMAAGTLAVYVWAGADSTRATTLAFTTFVLFQVVNAVNVRLERGTVFARHTLTNSGLWIALGIVVALQMLAVQWSALHGVFGTTALTLDEWAVAAGVAGTVLVVEEARLRIVHSLANRG